MSDADKVQSLSDLKVTSGGKLLIQDFDIEYAIQVIKNTYGDVVSVDQKLKDLIKFGTCTTSGTAWEDLAENPTGLIAESYATTNAIDSIISTSTADVGDVYFEGHVLVNGSAVFTTGTVTMTGQTTATLPISLFRVTRVANTSGTTALAGNVSVYESVSNVVAGVVQTVSTVHLYIPAGEQQSQKCSTTVSGTDYWIVTTKTLSVTEKTGAWAEARVESKTMTSSVFLPKAQNISASDGSGTTVLMEKPYIIIPKNSDVRMAVRTNASGVSVAGGIRGYLAKVVT